MNPTHGIVAVAIATTLFSNSITINDADEPPSIKYEIKGQNGIEPIDRDKHYTFTISDSLDDLLRQKERDTLARERLPQESPAYENKEGVTLLYPDKTNNCTKWVKQKLGISRSLGAGARQAINTQTPEVGEIGSLRDYVHAVYITGIAGEIITFEESNYIKNYITSRTLPREDFLGFVEN